MVAKDAQMRVRKDPRQPRDLFKMGRVTAQKNSTYSFSGDVEEVR
jgi:hypothetical protein